MANLNAIFSKYCNLDIVSKTSKINFKLSKSSGNLLPGNNPILKGQFFKLSSKKENLSINGLPKKETLLLNCLDKSFAVKKSLAYIF